MLNEIYVQDYALVDKLRIEFDRGFTVLTGETGAGKSIIVGAISTVLGERTSADIIRTNAEKCRIEAIFDISDSLPIKTTAESAGIDVDDDILIISREIAKSGKSTCRINGQTVTASILRNITDSLIDIHGQHDHQSLLVPAIHIDIFDSWIGQQAFELRKQTENLFNTLSAAISRKEQLNRNVRERERKIDLLSFQLQEIGSADLVPGEIEHLVLTSSKLASAEKLFEGSETIYQLFSDDNAVLDMLQEASLMCDKLAAIDPELQNTASQMTELVINAQDVCAAIREYRDNIDLDETALETVENRLNLINTLRRKYGDTIEEILQFRDTVAAELSELQMADELSSDLDQQIENLRSKHHRISAVLSDLRKSKKENFEKAIETHLADLAMNGTEFRVDITSCLPGEKGYDAVEFLICPNPGEPLKPLSKIASGGEISRVMLAIKTVCSASGIPTLIFDEIDTGIGGVTGIVLGKKISALSDNCQILCVTHLPQVACVADRHLNVAKTVDDGHTTIRISTLNENERIIELARMLGSDTGSDTAMEHAREMLTSADKGNRKTR